MVPNDKALVRRINTDPAYHDVIKLIGYLGIQTPIGETDFKRLVERYGRERVGKASEVRVDIDAE